MSRPNPMRGRKARRRLARLMAIYTKRPPKELRR